MASKRDRHLEYTSGSVRTERRERYKKVRRAAGTYRCFFWPDCHAPDQIEVHHLRYRGFSGEEEDSDLELLCSYHHERVEAWARRHASCGAVHETVLEAFRPVAGAEDAAGKRFRLMADPRP